MSARHLDFLLRPRSVALVGASDRPHSIGTAVMRNLLKGGFRGPVFPVHATRRSVAGVHAYRDAAALPETPDLALICTPPETVPGLVHELGVRGSRAIVVLTDGVEHEPVLAGARPHLARILGPGSMGLLAPALGLNASFAPLAASPGSLALVSQSGALLAAALDRAASRKIGFSYAISLGDACDVDAADLLDFLGNDPATRAVLLYIESIRDGRRFLSAARATSRSKPVIVMKSGGAGDDDVFNAAVERAGMLRVGTMAGLFEAAETVARMHEAGQSALVILTNARGPAVIAADAAAAAGVQLAGPPIDIGGDATAPRYAEALRASLAQPQHTVLLIHGPSAVVGAEAVAEACADCARESGRTLACWMGGERAHRAAERLRKAGVPVYETPEAAVEAFARMQRYRRNQEALQEAPASAGDDFTPDEKAARALLARVLADGRERLTDPEGKALLAAYGIPVVHTHAAADADEAARLAAEIGYPVALKVLSPDLEHRSEVGGVVLNLEDEAQLRRAAGEIAGRLRQREPPARLAGFTVQRMIRPPGAVHRRHGARELALRAAADPLFGMVVRLDGAVGLAPLNPALALRMVDPGKPESPAIATAIARLSELLVHHPEIVALDIDPLLVDAAGVMALEVRARPSRQPRKPGAHLAIRPYPRELEEQRNLDGLNVLLRPVRPADVQAYIRFIEASDAGDVQLRFATMVRRLPARDLARYTQIDYDREMAFVAATGSGPALEILGEARVFGFPGTSAAEFALLVRSDMQRRGLGKALLEKTIAYCRRAGYTALIGQVAPENEAMLSLARRCGMAVDRPSGASLAVVHLDLEPRAPEVKLF